MRVTSSAATNGQTVSVDLEEADVPGAEHETNVQRRHQMMMVAADTMVVRYLLESEQITNEYASTRMKEINSRASRVPV